MQSLRNGTQLGAYTVIQLIARGGMGEVYEAHEVNLQRKVALKVIAPPNPDEHDHQELIHRFLQEARTLARVNHPNIVTIYAIESIDEIPFIAMEYIEGVSFKELLKEIVLTADAAAPLFEQILEGVRCLHENRIVHRDLKPHNILLRPDRQIKILDFGIAKHASAGEYTQVGVVVGTLPYMAPELKSGIAASPQSDFWSLGAIFYECLVGTPLVLAQREAKDPREVPYPSNCRIPPEMRAIINKLCAPRPSDRYETAIQVIEDLRRFQLTRPYPNAEVWAAISQKITEIADKRRRKNAENTGPIPTITPAPAPIDLALAEVSHPSQISRPFRTNVNAQQKKRPQFDKRHALGAAGAALALTGALFAFWPRKSVQKPAVEVPKQATVPTVRPVTPTSPRPDEVVWLGANAVPTMTWSRPVSPGEFEIQIAPHGDFSKPLVREPVTGQDYRPARILPEGDYAWRLVEIKSPPVPSAAIPFRLAGFLPPEPQSPESGDTRSLSPRAAYERVEFHWSCKTVPATYVLQVRVGEETIERRSEDCVQWVELKPGRYQWRVALHVAGQDAWSGWRALQIREAAVNRLAQPKIITPKRAVTLAFKGRAPASLTNAPKLEWTPVKGAAAYLVQFSGTPDFSRLYSEEKSRANALEWKNAVPGRVHYRVAALTAEGDAGPYSNPSTLDVRLPAPALDKAYRFQPEPGRTEPLRLEWPAVPMAQAYLVQTGTSRALASAQSKVVKTPLLELEPREGVRFVRVAAVDASGEIIGAQSNVARVDVIPHFTLDTPTLLLPKDGTKAATRGRKISIAFKWTPVAGATSYRLEVAEDPDFEKPVFDHDAKVASVIVKRAGFTGTLFWRVRARSANGLSDWSEIGTFELTK